ncbi:cyclic nucleotide-binding domain-containing protein [Pacificispira sp.]|uniref:cyclic nucleotide-binding domain-containing protein n=1 Tax=Pacificispira sp. TaxID=2888761 RepID=UPI003BA8F1FD
MEGELRNLGDGEIVFRQDEPSDFACLIDSGEVEVFMESAEGEIAIALLGPGEMLGEMGVIDGRPRSASARAKGQVSLREFQAQTFLDQISVDPKFASDIMTVLVTRLRKTTAIVEGVPKTKPVTPAESSGSTTPGACTVNQPSAGSARPDAESAASRTAPVPGSGGPAGKPAEKSAKPVSGAPSPKPLKKLEVSTDASMGGPQRADKPIGMEDSETPGVSGNLPRVLIGPLLGDPQGICFEALKTWLDRADSFVSITWADERMAEPGLSWDSRISQARRSIAEAGAALALIGAVQSPENPRLIELAVVTPWPDEEARVGGFSVHDRFFVPIDASNETLTYCHALIRAAIPGRAQGLFEALERDLPLDLPRARTAGVLNEHRLSNQAIGRQLVSFGNAIARAALLEQGTNALDDAAEAYREAIKFMPREDALGRGMAFLHLALVLNAKAERAESLPDRMLARDAVAQAAKHFDGKKHTYQYLTAHARHGAILYRCALETADLDACKQGVEAFNRALAVCDKRVMQDPWADTMNGLGQILILLGRLAKNTEFLTWASQVCRNAMEIRNREHNPLGWARTQNNRATALYLLGRAEGQPALLKDSIEAFSAAAAVFQTYRAKTLADTAKRNRKHAEGALDRVQSGKMTKDAEWWAG